MYALIAKKIAVFGIVVILLSLSSISIFSQNPPQKREYQGIIEIGGGISIFEERLGFFQADIIYGIKYNDYFSMGIGIGIRAFPEEIPLRLLYGNFRVNLGYNRYEKVYPYIQNKIGFSFPGVVNHLSTGLGFKKSLLTIGIGTETILQGTGGVSVAFVPIGLNIGFTF